MTDRKISTRTRYVIMTEADDAAFSRALKEMYPEVVFAAAGLWTTARPPIAPSIPESNSRVLYVFFPPPDWEPSLKPYQPRSGPPTGWYSMANWPPKYLHYVRPLWQWSVPYPGKWAFDFPTLLHGSISTSYPRDEVETKRFIGKVWRLLEKLTSNQFKIEYPHLGIVMGEKKTDTWAGHDALRWCSRGRTRMLDGAFRPADSWRFPDLPWYRDEDQLRFPSPDEPADTDPPAAT